MPSWWPATGSLPKKIRRNGLKVFGGSRYLSHFQWEFFFFTWEGFVSLLPLFAVIVGIYARWQEKPSQIRFLGLVGTLLWLPYTVIVHSYAGTLTQLVLMVGILYGIMVHDRKKVVIPEV